MNSVGIIAAIATVLGGGGLVGFAGAWWSRRKPQAEARVILSADARADFAAVAAEWRAQLAEVKADRAADRITFNAQQATFVAQASEMEARHEECTRNLAEMTSRVEALEARGS